MIATLSRKVPGSSAEFLTTPAYNRPALPDEFVLAGHDRNTLSIFKEFTMRVALITIVSLFCATPAFAQESPKVTPNWESLFNGKDLSGWKKIGDEKWIVEDGAIYGEGITEKYGYLATEKTYQDFELELKFKCEASGNSGVYIHTTFEPGTPTVIKGRQIEIDRAIGHHTAGIYGDGKGWIVWPAPELETIIKPDDWNDLRISVIGKRYITRLNGTQMIDFTYPSPVATDGVIALQLHSGGEGRMRFKDLRIRDFTDRTKKPAAAKK